MVLFAFSAVLLVGVVALVSFVGPGAFAAVGGALTVARDVCKASTSVAEGRLFGGRWFSFMPGHDDGCCCAH